MPRPFNRRFNEVLPASYIGIEVRVEVANPGMCDFPFRREAGTGNRIPGDFFAYFFGRATDAAAESHRGWLRLPPRRSAALKPACTALTGNVGCTNGRGARRKPKATKSVPRGTIGRRKTNARRRQTVHLNLRFISMFSLSQAGATPKRLRRLGAKAGDSEESQC